MKKFFSHIFSPSTHNPSRRGLRGLWQRLLEPAAIINETSERRQVRMVSASLLTTSLNMIIAVIYLHFFSSTPSMAFVFVGAEFVLVILYFLSRTRYNQLSGNLFLIVMSLIPFLCVVISNELNLEGLLIFLIANTMTVLISSAITSIRNTILFAIFDILTLLLVLIFIPSVSYEYAIFALLSNISISSTILVFVQHRNLLEKDRYEKMAKLTQNLQAELTQRELTEDILAYISAHDPLTDLPNRVLFIDRLSHAMERAKLNENFMYAVFYIDLARFRLVNDCLGHVIGDKLLVECAHRISAHIRGEDTVSRLSGDDFVVLLEDVEDTPYVIQVAERIQDSIAMPYVLDGNTVSISASMGIVISGASYDEPNDVLRDAEIAMSRADEKGLGSYEFFDPSMLDRAMSRMELETDLRKALDDQQFVVHYQPIIEMASHRIVGFEALVRWQHPTKGLVPPGEFIPSAEETNLIIPLGYWVLDEACRQIHTWNVQYSFDQPLTVSVNLSTKQCEQPDLVQKIYNILRKNNLDASLLKLELTESLIAKDTDRITAILSELNDLGIQVLIDDFGTGYSSLSYLFMMPIDILKIDRSFINRLGSKNNGKEIVQTILSLAHNLGMKVIAEGVETDEQFSELLAMNCEFMQGFLFSKPLDNLEVGALLEKSMGDVEE